MAVKHINNKNQPDIPSVGKRPVQRVEVEESTQYKWVNFGDNLGKVIFFFFFFFFVILKKKKKCIYPIYLETGFNKHCLR